MAQTMEDADVLNRDHALDHRLRFRAAAGGLVLAEIDTEFATASISLQGGQVLAWQPRAQASPVIWLSPRARYAIGSAIRGGIPVCWPWFGAHPQDGSLPAHGIARTSSWRVVATGSTAEGETTIVLELAASGQARALLPQPLTASLAISVGKTLRLALTTRNDGEAACAISEALHSYFAIGDIGEVSVTGLEDCCYIDKVAGGARRRQVGPIAIKGETDRVYLDTRSSCNIVDTRLGRTIRIDKSGSASTVVWSPGPERAAGMADIGADAWRQMLCVESANALDDQRVLAPGDSHTLAITCSLEAP